MRRVVITGMGIVSSLGNNVEEVSESLKNSKSGITFQEEYKNRGLRSQVAGSINLDTQELIDRKLYRFMANGHAYAWLAMQEAIEDADAIITLRLQKERMSENLITSLDRYHIDYGINHQSLQWCKNKVPVLHPGPVNRGVEMSSTLLDDKSICLIDRQVTNGIAVRMAILYLMLAKR